MKYKLLFIAILLLAFVLRFYKLGTFPSGLTWDETAIGYNAYSIATVHRDEWLRKMPVVFTSFGDNKSPLGIYATAVLLFVFPLTAFIVRLPVAIAGIGLVVMSYFLMQEILKRFVPQKKEQPDLHTCTSLFVMFLVAISPWALHYSRIGFESMIAAFLVSIGVYGWLKGREKGIWYGVGDIAFVLSLYAYHSAKVVVPLIGLVLIVLLYKEMLQAKKWVVLGTLAAALLLVPLGIATVFGKANDRALSTTIFSKPNAAMVFASNYSRYFRPSYLLFGEDITYRHGTRAMGVLYAGELALCGIGLVWILKSKNRKLLVIPLLYAVSVIPAALGTDVPHSNRALLGLPWIQILAGIGLYYLLSFLSKSNFQFSIFNSTLLKVIGIWSLVFGIFALHLFFYLQIYAETYSSSVALKDFGYGLEEAISFARSQEGKYNKIYFTNDYGQAYIYILFYKRMNPIDYRGGGLANYVISDNPYNDAKGHANVLVIGTPEEIPDTVGRLKEIKYPDGKVVLRIVEQ